jgi:hypothetical protein
VDIVLIVHHTTTLQGQQYDRRAVVSQVAAVVLCGRSICDDLCTGHLVRMIYWNGIQLEILTPTVMCSFKSK